MTELAEFDPDRLAAIFSERPAIHRYPKAMAARVQDLARLITDQYDGDAARLWETAGSGAELLKRVAALPGFGAQKAQIFVALLVVLAIAIPAGAWLMLDESQRRRYRELRRRQRGQIR